MIYEEWEFICKCGTKFKDNKYDHRGNINHYPECPTCEKKKEDADFEEFVESFMTDFIVDSYDSVGVAIARRDFDFRKIIKYLYDLKNKKEWSVHDKIY